MSDFIAANLHKKIDHIMDVFYGAGVASHPTIIEQINYLLFMRALSQHDEELKAIGVTDANELVFDGDLEKYHWDNLMTLNAEQLFIALEDCLRKIPESTTNKTVRLVFRNAHIKLFDKASLRTVFHEIDAFGKLMDEGEHEGKKDIFGDAYEYLLSKLAQAGTSGQFRTPRHIIDFLVAVVAPKKGETILDPAVGTAGFLVKAFESLRREYTSPEQLASGGSLDQLTSKEHSFLFEHTFNGFDSDEDMIKFGMMNLYLHGLQNAKLIRQNTLTDTAGSRDKYDIILANPPFSGKIDRDSVAEELQMNTGATEVLFLRYMMRHLTDNGRVGVIVPEGVLFNASGAHTKIREMLLDHGLWCVVSLPGGVFNPYAGVKTSILFFDKTRKDKAEVLFAKVEHDGFSLSTQRRAIAKNDLPEILEDIKHYQNGEELQQPNAHAVSYERIKETKDFNLSGDRYRLVQNNVDHDYPIVELGEYVEYVRGLTYSKKDEVQEGGVSVLRANNINLQSSCLDLSDVRHVDASVKTKPQQKLSAGDIFICAASGSKQHIGKVAYIQQDTDFYFGGFMAVLRTSAELNSKYLYFLLRGKEFNDFLQSRISSASINNLNAGILKSFSIPLLPLEIQEKIVEEIENKQMAIDHAREIIKTLERERAYFDPSARAQKEGWPIVKLTEVFDSLETGVSVNSVNHPRKANEYGVLKTSAVTNGVFLPNENKTILPEEQQRAKTHPRKDSIIISRMNTEQLVGASAYVDQDYPNVFLPDRLWQTVTSRTDVSMRYISHVLASKPFRRRLSGIAGGTSGSMKNISKVAFLELKIPLPPLDVQQQVVLEFAEEQKIATANQKLINLYTQKIQSRLAEIWGE